jgi:hypothetical protein
MLMMLSSKAPAGDGTQLVHGSQQLQLCCVPVVCLRACAQ